MKVSMWKVLFLVVLMGAAICGSVPAEAGTVFKLARAEDVAYWDPLDHFNLVNYTINCAMYDQLVARTEDGQYKPRAATSWEMREEGKVWNFKLRNDIVFHNGEKLTAHSVKNTIERFLSEKLRQSSNWAHLDSVELVNDYEVNIKFKEPNGAFMSLIACFSILPMDTVNKTGKDEFFKHPIGSGPYKFVEWVQGQRIVLEKNNDYWGEKGRVDRIEYYPIMEDTTRVSALRAGDVDFVDNVPADMIKLLESDPEIEIQRYNTFDAIYIGLKCNRPPFNDVNARKALHMCLDRKGIVDAILGGGAPSNWPVPRGVLGDNPGYPLQEMDVEGAKAALKASNYDGKELVLSAPSTWYARTKEVLQAVQSQMAEVGFKVRIEMMDGAAFMERRAAGAYDFYYTGCAQLGGDPIVYLSQRIQNDSMKSEYDNDQLKKMVADVEKVADPQKRAEGLRAVFQVMMDEHAPHMFVYEIENISAKKKNIKGEIMYPDKILDFALVEKN